MSEHDKKTMVVLNCRHPSFFTPPPLAGDEVYCLKCGAFRIVLVPVAEWRVRCQHCTLSIHFGEDPGKARRSAVRHVARFPGHRVDVFQGNRLDSTTDVSDQVVPGSLPDRYHTVTLL